MFEKFTDRARKAMGHARQEAQHLCHEYIGTEHMLLGLAHDRDSLAGEVLARCGVDLIRLAAEVCKRAQPGGTAVTMGQVPFTPRAKRALEDAEAARAELRHNHLGTEHLLIGLAVGEGTARVVLDSCDISAERVRELVVELVDPPEPVRPVIDVEDVSTDVDRAEGRMRVRMRMDLPAEMRGMLDRQLEILRQKAAELAPACGACGGREMVHQWGRSSGEICYDDVPCPDCQGGTAPWVRFRYRNHRGEVAVRRAVPGLLYFGRSDHHGGPDEMWLLRAWDLDKGATRDYALRDVLAFDPEEGE